MSDRPVLDAAPANPDGWTRNRGAVGVVLFGAGVVLVMAVIVAMGVNRELPPAFALSPLEPRPAGGRLVGPELVTVDATPADRWTYFSFDQGSVVERPDRLDWDLAFRRFQVIANGGPGFAGTGGLLDLGEIDFEGVRAVPGEGYVPNTVRSDTVNTAMRRWYRYSYLSHLLTPKPNVYAVRTADGRYAKIQFVGYYCPGATPGCLSFRYVFQGAGGQSLVARR